MDLRVLFLDASDDALVRRFEQVRRPHPLQGEGRVLDAITSPELKKYLEAAVIACEPNKALVRQQLQTGEQIPGAALIKGEQVRFD